MDLHSGVFGGTVHEVRGTVPVLLMDRSKIIANSFLDMVALQAMVDLVWMMNQLVDQEGTILVEGLMDSVAPVTPEEEAKYHSIGTPTATMLPLTCN